MQPTRATFTSASDATTITTYAWKTERPPRGVVQLSHGLAEHALRYERLAQALTAAGYHVYASDHRGHGRSVASAKDLGSLGVGGWAGLVADVMAFGRDLRARHPGLPLFLLSHSMGSFAAQQVVLDASDMYAGLVLAGSTALDVMAAALAQGGAGGGDLSSFNAGFTHRTGYEWLSRDEAEVDKYVADPLCGFALPADTVPQLFTAAQRLADPAALRRIREGLPILVVSGQADPLAGQGQLVGLLAQRYRDAGLTDVTLHVYPEARHELFNETNRDEVTTRVTSWLNDRTR